MLSCSAIGMQTDILLAVYTIYFLPNLNHFFFCAFSFEGVSSSSCCDFDCLDLPDCSERREYLDHPETTQSLVRLEVHYVVFYT